MAGIKAKNIKVLEQLKPLFPKVRQIPLEENGSTCNSEV
jgi:hypothetical protein